MQPILCVPFASATRKPNSAFGGEMPCNRSAAYRPDVLILVDYPGFNLKIARYAKEQLHLPVHYYISPKIWAWKEYRIKEIKRYVDRMYSILPFEVDFYRKHGYAIDYVGNPTVDELAVWPYADESFEDFTAECGLGEPMPMRLSAILRPKTDCRISLS